MTQHTNNTLVAVYDTHDQAENAIKELSDASIPMKSISIMGRGYHTDEKVVGFYNADDRMKFWGKYGAFWGGLWGLLAGGLFVTAPLTGPIVVLGTFGAVVLGVIEGAVIVGGASALAAAFFSIGIPKDSIVEYESAIHAEDFVVLVQGTIEETERARRILKEYPVKKIDLYNYDEFKKAG